MFPATCWGRWSTTFPLQVQEAVKELLEAWEVLFLNKQNMMNTHPMSQTWDRFPRSFASRGMFLADYFNSFQAFESSVKRQAKHFFKIEVIARTRPNVKQDMMKIKHLSKIMGAF